MRGDLQADGAFESHRGQNGPADVLVRYQHAVIAQKGYPPGPERLCNTLTELRRRNQSMRILVDADTLGEKRGIMREKLQLRIGCTKRSGVRWMGVDN